MPAKDEYDAVHPLTVAGERYGCYNRKPFKDWLVVQDGWRSNGTRNTVTIPDQMSKECYPPENDPRCGDCKWRG